MEHTKEEAIQKLEDKKPYEFPSEHWWIDMAIHALQTTCDIEKSNFDMRQYRLDTDTAYDCGYNAGLQAQADGEYISKEKAIIQLSWDLSEVELPRIKESLDKLPSVAIPLAEPKTVPIAVIRFDDDKLHEIVEEAVKNIEIEPKWIPTNERLPEKDGEYLATVYDTDENYKYMDIAELEDGIWQYKDYIKVLAWMPLPPCYEPRKGAKE